MTPGDGLELTRLVRNHPTSPNRMAPVILITGYSSLPRVHEARDAGVTEFLVKPFTANDVAKRIAHVVNFPRDFISHPKFFGPDRRRKRGEAYAGPKRRVGERETIGRDAWMISFKDE
jgi:two-component system, chemotaxis family, chemotaxis protein CheY